MECYVVRVYRRTESDPQHVVGLIEIVQDGQQRRFSSMEELWEILTAEGHEPRLRVRRGRKPEDR